MEMRPTLAKLNLTIGDTNLALESEILEFESETNLVSGRDTLNLENNSLLQCVTFVIINQISTCK